MNKNRLVVDWGRRRRDIADEYGRRVDWWKILFKEKMESSDCSNNNNGEGLADNTNKLES